MFIKNKLKYSLVILPLLFTQVSIASDHFILSVLGGYANLDQSNNDQVYIGDDSNQFVYNNNGSNANTGLVGVFAGMEWLIPNSSFLTHLGLEYDYMGSMKVNGDSSVGVEPSTSTPYIYQYREQTQQLMAVGKLFIMNNHRFHPYVMAGMGAAFNRLYDFSTSTAQTGSINLMPTFNDNTHTSFAYSLGAGIEISINQYMSLGMGYRFSDFGKSEFGRGEVIFNDYQAEVPFSLANHHTYANQLIVNLNFMV